MPTGGLPTFVIIGAMKCGTTSLHEYLGAHPEISVSEKKELDFFLPEHFDPSLASYRQWFPESGVCGESSPNYSKAHLFPGVPARMHSVIPEAKLIYLVRDPIDRLVSHWSHAIANGRRTPDPDKTFGKKREHHNFFQTGLYDVQLEVFLEYYAMKRVLVLTAEELRDDRVATIRRAFEFLEVDPGFEDPSFEAIHHVSSDKTVGKSKDGPRVARPELGERWDAWMRERLKPHMERFRAMTGLALDHWSV